MTAIYNSRVICALLTAALLPAFAPLTTFAADIVLPDAGAILQQLPAFVPLVPSPSRGRLTIKQTDENKVPAGPQFLVQSFQIIGNTRIDTPTLLGLVASAQGKTLTISDLAESAALITRYYHDHDFPLARAIIPPQTITHGEVRIEVIEALYGEINLDNTSQVVDSLLQATLSQLRHGEPITQTKMDHVLLLLSDIPGVMVDATLKPGSEVGSSDLVVSTTPGQSIFGSVMLDNYGNRYTGRTRLSGSLSVLNLLHYGDALSVNTLSSGGDMRYGRLGYESSINKLGTRIGASYSALNYVLGEPITTDIHGTAQVGSIWARHPLMRSLEFNVYGQIQYDGLRLRDFYSSAIQTDRNLANWTLSLTGDTRDEWLAGSVNAWNLNLSSGRISFDNLAAQLADATTTNTQGNFSKWNASFVRLQSLTSNALIYLTASGQWAHSNLDSSQRMSIGGPQTVRAYDTGAVSGDKGYFLSAEYRYKLSQNLGGQWQAVSFLDSAHVIVNVNTWPGTTSENSATLNGVGLGLNWSGPDQWGLKAYVAKPVGAVPSLAGLARSTRVWVELVRRL